GHGGHCTARSRPSARRRLATPVARLRLRGLGRPEPPGVPPRRVVRRLDSPGALGLRWSRGWPHGRARFGTVGHGRRPLAGSGLRRGRSRMRQRLAVVVALLIALGLAPSPGEAQKRGGVLKFAVPSVKPGLDPAHTTTGDAYMLTQAIFSNLTRVDENLEAQPQLARSWEPNADSTVWTFHLVTGAKFHNGREVTADDVVFSFERILDPKTASPGAKALGPIKKVRAADKYTVVIELTGPYADLPLQLGNTFARIVAREK